MECHRCNHHADVEAGRYAGVPYEDTPCGRCELKESSVGTREYKDQIAINATNSKTPSPDEDKNPLNEHLVPESVVLSLVSGLLSLPPETLTVLALRWQGWKYREIAKIQGITMAAVELRHARAMKRWPMLGHLFPRKLSKQSRRRNRRKTNSLASNPPV
jgi:hypothetical protein